MSEGTFSAVRTGSVRSNHDLPVVPVLLYNTDRFRLLSQFSSSFNVFCDNKHDH